MSEVVVIGGGHNGLVAGCYLARAGLRTVLVEGQPWLGGMAATRAFAPDAPDHLLSPGAYENVYLRAAGIAADLDLPRFGYQEREAAGWAWLGRDGESLLFSRSVEETVRDVARFSRADAERYRELVTIGQRILAIQDSYGLAHPSRPGWRVIARALRTLAGDRRVRRALGAMVFGRAADAIPATFESEPVRGAFAAIGTILAPPTAEGSAIAMLSTALLHHKGAARTVGGMGGVVTALERCLRSHGGEVRTGAPAVSIRTRGGRACAVELADGTVLDAPRGVVAACPPQLVPGLAGDALDEAVARRLRGAPANATGVGTMTVNLALRGRVELPGHTRTDVDIRRPTLFGGTFDDVLAACESAARGELPQRSSWCVAIFTAIDPSQAPEGQDVAQLYAPVPVTPRDGWGETREAAAGRLVADVGAIASELASLELARYIETPDDLERRTGAPRGCIYHVDHLPTRMGPLRPAFGAGGCRTPLAGLYLGSAGSHPGGGVSGLPGRLCARVLLADEGTTRA